MQDNLNTAAMSEGTLTQQQEIYMDSLKAHMNELTAEAQEMYKAIFDEDTIKSFVDVAKDALSIINNILSGMGSMVLPTLAAGAVGAMSSPIAKGLSTRLNNQQKAANNKEASMFQEELIMGQYGGNEKDHNLAIEKQIENFNTIKEFRNSMSEEDAQQFTEIQKLTGEYADYIDYVDKAQDAGRKLMEELKVGKDDTGEYDILDFGSKIQDMEDALSIAQDLKKELSVKDMFDDDEHINVTLKALEKVGATEEEIQSINKDAVKAQELLSTKCAAFGKTLKQNQKIYKDYVDTTENGKENAEKVLDYYQQQAKALAEEKRQQQEIQTFVKGTMSLISTITGAIGLITSLTDESTSG